MTIRAEGTDPVTVDVRQESGRGLMYFGETGTETEASVTTSGGQDNSVQLMARGGSPSEFQGADSVHLYVDGTEVASEDVSIVEIVKDWYITTLVNDIPDVRTITTIPAIPNFPISSDTVSQADTLLFETMWRR